jgi:hypothetical protein
VQVEMGMYTEMKPCGMLVLPLNNLYWRRIGMEGGRRRGTMVWRSEVWRVFSGILGRMADLADFSHVSISNGDSMTFNADLEMCFDSRE